MCSTHLLCPPDVPTQETNPMTSRRHQPVSTPATTTTASCSVLLLTLFALGLSGCGSMAPSRTHQIPPPPATATGCADLKGLAIAAASMGLPTGGASITDASLLPPGGAGAAALGGYCKVLGEIAPVDPKAPKIRFQVNLPTAWNGKALMFGGGGYNGVVATGLGNVPAGPTDKALPLGRGYATFGSDSGHQAGPATSRDGAFLANDEALRNFAGDALKKTRDAATIVIQTHYAKAPQRSYFAGGSTGGREALLAVGNWPGDFDGAIVLYPAWNAAALNLHFGVMTRELAKPGAYMIRDKRKALLDASLQACDALDGLRDGVVANVRACEAAFDPKTALLGDKPLRCAGGADTGNDCLSDAQIAGVLALERPLVLDYKLASGENGYPGFTTWGTDFGVPKDHPLQPLVLTLALGTLAPANPMPAVKLPDSPPYGSTFYEQWVKYAVTRDMGYDALSLDPRAPGPWQARIVELTALQDANRSDYSAFKARGGKILMAHGTHDALVSPRATRQLMDRLRKTMGDAALAEMLRYYEIPAYGHAVSTSFNAAWDSLTTLENWVERGIAPPPQTVTDTAGVPGRTRPLCEWPSWPRYNGSGDANVAASFECVKQ
jgi:Tannase and feruloyl esterase